MDETISVKFPVHATIAGVAVVTIPASGYAPLLGSRAHPAKHGKAERHPVPPRSLIETDDEVKAFFTERASWRW